MDRVVSVTLKIFPNATNIIQCNDPTTSYRYRSGNIPLLKVQDKKKEQKELQDISCPDMDCVMMRIIGKDLDLSSTIVCSFFKSVKRMKQTGSETLSNGKLENGNNLVLKLHFHINSRSELAKHRVFFL